MRTLRAGISALFAAMVIGITAQADDTELYVAGGNVVATSRPQVLVIFDNSGSMDTLESDSFVPYDPDIDYSDGSDRGRIYYVRGSVDAASFPDPSDSNEKRYFDPASLACGAANASYPGSSYSILERFGTFTDNMRYFQYGKTRSNGIYWKKLKTGFDKFNENNRAKWLIECRSDLLSADANNAPSHPIADARSSGFAIDGNEVTPFDGTAVTATEADRSAAAITAAGQSNLGSDDVVTLFTENYLHYSRTTSTASRERLEIAKDAIESLIYTTPGVDFGLMVFNKNAYDDSGETRDHGGKVIKGIKDNNESYRGELINAVRALDHNTWTPLCETLFEAANYYRGIGVVTGKLRSSTAPVYDSSVITDNRYISPFRRCQNRAYVVLITDGAPTRDNDLDSTIKSDMGLANSDKVDGNLLAGVADYMANNDMNGSMDGVQKVITYTIGFSSGADSAANLLTQTAQRGGGEYYRAENAAALQASLSQIFSEILAINASYTSPSVSASATDRTSTGSALYYGMFLPSDRPRWRGNLKKLKITSDGEVVDARGRRAIAEDGSIKSSACSVWTSSSVCSQASDGGDGNDVTVGGVYQALKQQTTRTIKTIANGALVDLSKANLSTAAGSEAELAALWLTDSNGLTDYVSWLKGVDVDDENEDDSRTDVRDSVFGDPLHSKPLAITYRDNAASEDVRILIGTNQGFLHMFQDHGDSVSESWAVYIPELLEQVPELRNNPQTGGHSVYGLDGAPVAYVKDVNADGEIGSGDKAWVYVGMRRGGSSYYAFDVTDPDNPRFEWRISPQSAGFSELGQSWSEPVITKIRGHDNPVLIFGGGYDTGKDADLLGGDDDVGRAIYIVDAFDGSQVHRFAGVNSGAGVTPFAATDSLPNKIAILDSDADGFTDRLYATDTGANVWRVDMPSAVSSDWRVNLFASLGGDTVANDRRFFAEVSVAQTSFELKQTVSQPGSSERFVTVQEMPYDAVVVGSGNRTHPNGTSTHDHLFALQDRQISTQVWNESNQFPAPILAENLYSVAGDPFANVTDGDDQLAKELALGEKLGWYYPLGSAEKSLSAPLIIAGTAYFTTFVPGDVANAESCVAVGRAHLYGFNLQQGVNLLKINIGSALPDTPQVLVPPPPDSAPEDWNPALSLVGVGQGEDGTGTVSTSQMLVPSRVYYHYGGQ